MRLIAIVLVLLAATSGMAGAQQPSGGDGKPTNQLGPNQLSRGGGSRPTATDNFEREERQKQRQQRQQQRQQQNQQSS